MLATYQYVNENVKTHFSPFDLEKANTEKLSGSRIVGFIHSHGGWDRESDNRFSTHMDKDFPVGNAFALDEDLYQKNLDLDFYLATPEGSLKVKRAEISGDAVIIAVGFYYDENVLDQSKQRRPLYGPNSSKINPTKTVEFNNVGFDNN